MEKVIRFYEEKLTELTTFIFWLSERPVRIKQYNRELEHAEVRMDKGVRYHQEAIEKMGKNGSGRYSRKSS